MSQTGLGRSVGLTFQQVQKYERGSNRMGSSRLYELAAVLDVPISYFLAEYDASLEKRLKSGRSRKAWLKASGSTMSGDPLNKRETLELVRAFYKIRKTSLRKQILGTIRAIGDEV
jgi:transcriptional regulator with XRE-family HTH domain